MREDWSPRLKVVAAIGSIGTAQLIAWGALYYAIAVMSEALRRHFQLSDVELFGAFASSVALSGLLAPWAGRALRWRCRSTTRRFLAKPNLGHWRNRRSP